MTTPEPIPFQPDRFRSAAAHYLSGRASYAEALFADVALLCRLDGAGAVLDLGCGPGQLARAFRPYAASALGLDPEPEMLALATGLSQGQDIEFRQASSQDLAPGMGPFRLVTIGRAFHWMDRIETLRRLDRLVVPRGAIVLFRTEHIDVPDNAWRRDYEAAIDRATGVSQRQPWRRPGWVKHEGVLLDSAFSHLRRAGVVERRRTPGAALLDRALSMSSSTRARLGPAVETLREDLAALVRAAGDTDGMVTEVVESEALIAQRPDRA